jgi:hypothetical protein
VVAALALLFSQLPPLRLLLRGPQLRVEVDSTLALSVHLGAPNAQVHIILSNNGGKALRIAGSRFLSGGAIKCSRSQHGVTSPAPLTPSQCC